LLTLILDVIDDKNEAPFFEATISTLRAGPRLIVPYDELARGSVSP
jgi:hypothetical protein